MRSVVPAILASTLALTACGGSTSTNSHPNTVTDSGSTTDAAVAADVPTYPAGPYGSSMGTYFQPFTLQSCNYGDAGDANWTFDQPDFYSSTLTVISIAAGWCVPCQMESAQMQATIEAAFSGMGVRVVQILVQNPDHSTITSEFCGEWVARYGIQFPELIDPLMMTSIYTPDQAFPGNIIVDRHGIIRWREYGESTGLTDLVSAIQNVLANPNNPGQ